MIWITLCYAMAFVWMQKKFIPLIQSAVDEYMGLPPRDAPTPSSEALAAALASASSPGGPNLKDIVTGK